MPMAMMKIGRCQNCEFAGLVMCVSDFLSKAKLDALAADPEGSIESETLFVCSTCFETPRGVLSANLAHRRLPESEYLQ